MSFWPPISSLLLSYILLYIATTKTTPVFGFTNETDREALVSIKSRIVKDPFEALSSWNDSINFCSWEGVSCSHRHMRVIALELSSLELAGSLSPYIGNLTFLKKIVLANNTFQGLIPQELGRLFRLQYISLYNNSFSGEFPVNLTRCTRLEVIDLSRNILQGKVSTHLNYLPNLIELRLSSNSLTGTIPPILGNLSALRALSLSENVLHGSIPVEFGQLSNLEILELSSNSLSGTVPIMIYNISSIQNLSLAFNNLTGKLPPDLGLTLPKLMVLSVGLNKFSGPIPASITNASRLVSVDISTNAFTGPVPTNLGNLKNLQRLSFAENRMGSNETDDLRFLISLANCTDLLILHLNGNGYRGNLPDSIANLSSKLISLRLDENNISGSIPEGIGNLANLTNLNLNDNMLKGGIPNSIGNLTKLQGIDISRNELSGEIPPSIGNITLLTILDMQENLLQGSIPVSLGNYKNLLRLDLSSNQLIGAIPAEVIGLSSLSLVLNLSHNHLNGSLPMEVGNLGNLGNLDISYNNFSGKLPQSLGSCLVLEFLNVEGNLFEGAIPQSLESLRGIQVLDLSHNNFSGTIPGFLGKFHFIQQLDISFNMFEGEIPNEGIFGNLSAFFFSGNENLCGGVEILKLPACPKEISTRKRRKLSAVKVAVLVSGITLGLLMFLAYARATLYQTKKVSKKEPILELEPPLENQNYPRISYAELVQATDGFSPNRLIGQGKFSSVYKGALSSVGPIVAVKVLNLQQSGAAKCFAAECEALRNTRHRNIVKIITSCSGIDFKGNDFKALVLEIMPNGSLESWLHPNSSVKPQSSKKLNFIQRLNIAIDVASAVSYLHHHCKTPVVHCDLKPSNIFLDNDLCAQLGDFGLARFLPNTKEKNNHAQNISAGIKGTIGYIAPEYGLGGAVSIQGDVYSFGILLLEIFIRKRPTDSMFKDDFSLHNYVRMAFPDRVMEIVDPTLVLDERDNSDSTNQGRRGKLGSIGECLESILRIGVKCSAPSPRERMNADDALALLLVIKNAFLGLGRGERVQFNGDTTLSVLLY